MSDLNQLIDDIIAILSGATIDGETIVIEDMPVDQTQDQYSIEVVPQSMNEPIMSGGHPQGIDADVGVVIIVKVLRVAGWRTKVIAIADAVKHAWLSDAAMMRKWSQPTEIRTEFAIELGETAIAGASISLSHQTCTEYPPVIDGEFYKSVHTIRISGETL